MVFYFSGTGNSRHVAEQIAQATESRLINMAEAVTKGEYDYTTDGSSVGFVFPVYGWNLPLAVKTFISNLRIENTSGAFVFSVMTCGDDIGLCHEILEKELRAKDIELNAAHSVQMPNTYVCLPFFDVDSNELEASKMEQLQERLPKIINALKSRKTGTDVVKGGMPWIKTHILSPLFNKFMIHDRWFRVTSACNHCGRCAKVCPMNNITAKGETTWHGNCTGCLACYHACPHHAIQFGNMTKSKGQYTFKNKSGCTECTP